MSTFTQEDYDLINREFEDLRLASLRRCASQEEYEEVLRAFDFANEAHKGVRRRSGEPYIIHPIAVAKIVVQEIGLGYKSIVAALLHDVVEDTDYTVEDMKRLFGEKVASLVDGLTKIKAAIDSDPMSRTTNTLQAENFKRILLTLNDDVRVVLIKLADRLHNVRTIGSMPEYKKDKILSETMYIFIPLAQRLGLYSMKSEMENIWLQEREPEAFQSIKNKVNQVIAERCDAIDRFIEPISSTLKRSGYSFEIFKRIKTPYSIWRKMSRKGIPFEEIFDIFAIRIIFRPKPGDTERQQCWNIYTQISDLYTSKTDRIRDWTKDRKSNGYEALHCTVMSPMGTWIEIQIRSERMNEIAERGVAAHWKYKQEGNAPADDQAIDRWLQMVRDVLNNPDVNALEFLDNFHDSFLSPDIFVFTPKGESKVIPTNSTALDFAYYIHSQIGNRAIAAKINHKLAPLSQRLRNGDQVEIITAESQKPQREWLDFLHTPKAKAIVYEELRSEIEDIIQKGQQILQEALNKCDVKLNRRVLNKLMIEFSVKTKEELYNKIATRIIDLSNLERILRKNNQSKNVMYWTLQLFKNEKEDSGDYDEDDVDEHEHEKRVSEARKNPGKERLLTDDPVTMTRSYQVAECCYPIPGDNVVGFIGDDGQVIIHKKTCPQAINLAATKGDRIVNARWSKHTAISSLARIRMIGVDRLGILNELTKHITHDLNINMRKVFFETHDGIFKGIIDCYVLNTEVLETMMDRIRKVKGIESVTRIEITEN